MGIVVRFLLPSVTTRLPGLCQHQIPNKNLSFDGDTATSPTDWRIAARYAAMLVCILMLGGFSLPAQAVGSLYYVNNQAGSNCSDGGPHSVTRPWCSFAPLNKIRIFVPGDQILLARGATWNEELSIAGRGTADTPITLTAYGTGANPKILRNQATNDICVLLMDASHWNISNLEVGRASVGILLHYTQLFNQGITIRDVYAHDIKGIWAHYSREFPVRRHVLDPFATSLNINVSSGILFNLASYVKFSTSQYVLKDVALSNVHGMNNVDSVAFDAEMSTIENTDGHNAFQNVTLNGLFLANDSGHAAREYQRAGLGCSDSLRLLGMTNVTLLNSILYEEAGCHTKSGTAAVILGRVSDVTIANNIIFGVPESGSPDETAIDFEWSEERVNLHSNLFAGNAGAGVEILNIHPGDHTTAIDFSSNTFAQNAHAHHPGAASVWEDNYGRGYATPSGKLRNNFYFEEHGTFFAGKNIAQIADVNDVQTTLMANYAAEQFTPVQGRNQWRYMYELGDRTWKDMPRYVAGVDNGAWQASGGQFVSAFNLAPEPCSGVCDAGGVARVWIAPKAGFISIRGRVLTPDDAAAQVNAAITLVSNRNATLLWSSAEGQQIARQSDRTGLATDVDNIFVNAGDAIRFEVHSSGDRSWHAISWTPSVGYVPGDRESARAGTAPKNPKIHAGY